MEIVSIRVARRHERGGRGVTNELKVSVSSGAAAPARGAPCKTNVSPDVTAFTVALPDAIRVGCQWCLQVLAIFCFCADLW